MAYRQEMDELRKQVEQNKDEIARLKGIVEDQQQRIIDLTVNGSTAPENCKRLTLDVPRVASTVQLVFRSQKQ
jgi:predicted nuclease with TOPRIM domain